MASNKLSVNPNKTGYLLFDPNKVNLLVNIVNFGSKTISSSDSATNLDVIFQTDISLDKYILSLVKLYFLQLLDFLHIRPFISKIAAIIHAKASIHFHLDFVIASFTAFLNILFIAYKKYKIKLLASLLILLVFLTKHQLSNLYINFQFFVVLVLRFIALRSELFL